MTNVKGEVAGANSQRPQIPNGRLQALRVREALESPLAEKTIMFIEDCSSGAIGDVSELFAYCMQDPRFEDFTLVWVADDYDALLETFPRYAEHVNVRIARLGGVDFVRYLESARWVVTASYLPPYFVKRPDQMLIGCFGLQHLRDERAFDREDLFGVMPTLNSLDALLTADAKVADWVRGRRSDSGAGLRVIDTAICLRFDCACGSEGQGASYDIVVSLSPSVPGVWSSATSFNDLSKPISYRTRGNSVGYRIAPSFWHLAKEKSDDLLCLNFLTDRQNLARQLDGAKLLVTDNAVDLFCAQTLGVACIFFSYSRRSRLNIPGPLKADTRVVHSREELFDALEEFVASPVSAQERPAVPPVCAGAMEAVFALRPQGCASEVPRELVVLSWKDLRVVEDAMRMQGGESPFDYLLMRNDAIARLDGMKRFFASEHVVCRTGYHMGTDEERDRLAQGSFAGAMADGADGVFLAWEWTRLTGPVRYAKVHVPEIEDPFWKAMFAVAPAGEVCAYERAEDAVRVQREIG